MRTLAAGAIAVLTVSVWVAWTTRPQAAAIDSDAVAAASVATAAEGAGHALMRQPVAAAPAAASAAELGLAARIERLRASTDPRDAYRAYLLIAGCLHAREFNARVAALPMTAEFAAEHAANGHAARRTSEACQDISPLQIGARLSLAERAARAGVPGAVAAWTAEGPFGDKTALAQRPDDPLVVEWAQRAIEMIKTATKQGDVDAIGQFGLLCMNWELDEVDKLKVVLHDAAEHELQAQADSGQRWSQLAAAPAADADAIGTVVSGERDRAAVNAAGSEWAPSR